MSMDVRILGGGGIFDVYYAFEMLKAYGDEAGINQIKKHGDSKSSR